VSVCMCVSVLVPDAQVCFVRECVYVCVCVCWCRMRRSAPYVSVCMCVCAGA